MRCSLPAVLLCFFSVLLQAQIKHPPALSFDDLITLASVDPPPPRLENRLSQVLSEPVVDNSASLNHAAPRSATLRIAEWNINRLYRRPMVMAFSDAESYQTLVRSHRKLGKAMTEVNELQSADIVVLDEVDDGVKRSGYHNVPLELAAHMQMNYAYAVEFIELNPIYAALRDAKGARPEFHVDRGRYLGLEGTALLSRFPILSARTLRLPQEYDWYHQEIGSLSNLRKAEKWIALNLFHERLVRQVRRGGRLALIVRLKVPGVPSGTLTVVCPHLEDYTNPKGRQAQMQFLLKQVSTLPGPVLMAGDLNTLGHNGAPIRLSAAVRHYVLNYKFWLRQAFYFFEPVPGLRYAFTVANYVKNYHDPTAANIPILAANHSEPLFGDIRHFRFRDGTTFDLAGDRQMSYHHRGRTLSDTNQRAWKGFQPTFQFRRTLWGLFGEYKIDWMVAKKWPRFSLQQGQTLCALNTAVKQRISDHCPVTAEFAFPATGAKIGLR